MHVNNFFVCGPKFTVFFHPTWEGLRLINYFSDCRFLDPFRRCLRSNRKLSEIAPNFDGFFALPNFRGQATQKLYSRYHPGSRHVVWIKICDDIPISPEVIDVHTQNFKPNFKFSRLKFFGGTPVPVGVCAR